MDGPKPLTTYQIYKKIEEISGEGDRWREWSGRSTTYLFVELPMLICIVLGKTQYWQGLLMLYCGIRMCVDLRRPHGKKEASEKVLEEKKE